MGKITKKLVSPRGRGQLNPEVSIVMEDSVLKGEAPVHVFCEQNEMKFLVDSGAQISLVPKSIFNPTETCSTTLVAANGTPIAVYGYRDLFTIWVLVLYFIIGLLSPRWPNVYLALIFSNSMLYY